MTSPTTCSSSAAAKRCRNLLRAAPRGHRRSQRDRCRARCAARGRVAHARACIQAAHAQEHWSAPRTGERAGLPGIRYESRHGLEAYAALSTAFRAPTGRPTSTGSATSPPPGCVTARGWSASRRPGRARCRTSACGSRSMARSASRPRASWSSPTAWPAAARPSCPSAARERGGQRARGPHRPCDRFRGARRQARGRDRRGGLGLRRGRGGALSMARPPCTCSRAATISRPRRWRACAAIPGLYTTTSRCPMPRAGIMRRATGAWAPRRRPTRCSAFWPFPTSICTGAPWRGDHPERQPARGPRTRRAFHFGLRDRRHRLQPRAERAPRAGRHRRAGAALAPIASRRPRTSATTSFAYAPYMHRPRAGREDGGHGAVAARHPRLQPGRASRAPACRWATCPACAATCRPSCAASANTWCWPTCRCTRRRARAPRWRRTSGPELCMRARCGRVRRG